MIITLTGTQADHINQLESWLDRIKSMTTIEFMQLAEIKKPLTTPLG